MSRELPSVYDPKDVEDKWYKFWKRENLFYAQVDPDKKPFTIVIPPPNVTGQLHMGHALNNTLQDILIRSKRMQGYSALWLPGTDHAGIATEARVKEQIAQEGLTKEDLGREDFLKRVWEWKELYGDTIIHQLEKMGSSCDWSRLRFTMDEGLSNAVLEVFVRLYDKGLIYRGDYIVNWCSACNTTLSDIEVEYEEREDKLYYVEYPLEDGSGSITVATTRPETILGDTAVAVNPTDERYSNLVGKMVLLPILGRKIPIISDSYVDMEFGTGAVKITPGHDPNDFEIGLRHDLPLINVIDTQGKMNEKAGKFNGMDRFECRRALIDELKEKGSLVKTEDLSHNVGQCYRCDTVVEPLVSKQWFVKMKPLAKPAIEVVQKGEVDFVPDRFKRVYLNWLENIQDWCISRQLWWGHRIPAWYCKDCGEMTVSKKDVLSCPKCKSEDLEQDPDVLDTWFSSALWPFSTLGWPEDTQDLEYFYPTSVLVTAYDIIFFWVARMIFSGLEFMGDKPFKDVVITGLVRDAQGRKMSKSLGNGIDPLEVIDKYGADTLRFTLTTGNAPGNDMRFYWERVEASRNFANKIWNASRFVMMNLKDFTPQGLDLENLTLKDRWILNRTNTIIGEITQALDKFEIGIAAQKIYDFFWSEFCDWYIEMAKIDLYGADEKQKESTKQVLWTVLDKALKLLHPFMPFITEEIWQHLPHDGISIMTAPWPEQQDQWDFPDAKEMELVKDAIRGIRNIRAELNVAPGKKAQALVRTSDPQVLKTLKENTDVIYSLAKLSHMEFTSGAGDMEEKSISCVIKGAQILIPMEGLVDIDAELQRLEKELDNLKYEIERLEKKFANKGFMAKAPKEVVEKEQEKHENYLDMLKTVEERYKTLSDLA